MSLAWGCGVAGQSWVSVPGFSLCGAGKGAGAGERCSLPCAAVLGWCTVPFFLPMPLHDASCPGAMTVGAQLCLFCSAANKCSWVCSSLLPVFALERHRATGSPSVPVPSLWPWLVLPAPKPSAGSLLGGTGRAPPRTSLALPSQQGWHSPTCPKLWQSWTPGLPVLGQVKAPLCPDEAGGDRRV